jgi:mono/diheme cytochrome c family protein
MPAWGTALSDEQIAAVATYIRSAWNNRAGPVSIEIVAKVRDATKGRSQPWTASELESQRGK